MYDELVKELREAEKEAKELFTNPYRFIPYYGKAADAIEELSRGVSVLAKRAMAWAAEAEKAEKAHRWIPVTEAPSLKVGDEGYPGYLVYANGYYDVADYAVDWLGNGPSFHVDGEFEPDITHYMPLPEPPKEEL